MLYIDKNDAKVVKFDMGDVKIDFVNKDNTLWFTKKELSKFFDVHKNDIINWLSDIAYDEILIEGKNKKYYNLNKVIVLGYRLKKFKQTKILNLIHMYVKVQKPENSLLSRVKTSFDSHTHTIRTIVNI